MRRIRRGCVICACAFLCWAGAVTEPARGAETRAITLKDAIETALKANVDLKQAANQTEIQRISVRSNKMDFLPSVRASLGASRGYGKDYDTLSNRFEWSHSNSMNLSVSSGLDIFTGFGRIAALKQSQLQLEAQRKSYERSREQVIFETVQQFVLVVLDGDLIKVDEQYLESQRSLLAQIEAFTNSGKRPIVDLYQQQANAADAESRLLIARRDFEVDKFNLLKIMAVDPGIECTIIVPDVEGIGVALTGFLPADAAREAMASRTDLAAQRLQVEAAKKQITASRAGYWPTLSLSAGAGTSYRDPGSYGFNDQFYNNNLNGSIGLSLSIPIFDRLGTYNSVAQAKVGLRQAQLGAEKLERQTGVEIRQALEDYATARKAVDVAQAQSKYSAQALDNMEERYKVGASTLVELMQARASSLQSSYNLINAKYSHFVKGIAVLYYSGGIDRAMPLFD
ncbi:MAG: TolC family protein [Candidatus Krumholzibacteria bacterium]|nr:TolC family protein [Candidatus Krumholzibacteria bacterium]